VTLHLHQLTGCAPAPLAHYLKALGILRIVAEQKDPAARGWWRDEHFCFTTTLDRPELETFFLAEYRPTPFVSPWNKGSGFYNDPDLALAPLRKSVAERFAPFRAGVTAGFAELARLTNADSAVRALKDRTKARKGMTPGQKAAAAALKEDPEFKRDLATAEKLFKSLKTDLFTPCLRSWRGAHRAWMDAALVWLDEGKPDWPALLGTGGNDGRLDFTYNAMKRLGELFELASVGGQAKPEASELLGQSLWGDPTDKMVTGAAIGQFLPGSAGGANSTSGADGNSLVNPWDFVLMLEGAVLFSARSTRRFDPLATSRASAPFAVRSHPAGHGTRGREKAERGEQWMPLWSRPTGMLALRVLLGEARIQLGPALAYRPIDVARATSRLGVARGITAFTRFGYLERNGQATVAVPLGRFDVRARPQSGLVGDLAPWLDRLRRLAQDKHAPARLSLAEGSLADAVLAALRHEQRPELWQAVLLASTTVESIQACGVGFKAGPIPPLGPEWLAAADDGSVEWRLACALGSASARYDGHRPIDPVRHHWLPLRQDGRQFVEKDNRLTRSARVVIGGRDAIAECGALVERRLLEAAQRGHRSLPLVAARGCEASPSDLAELIAGRVDLARVSALARALMAVRWDRWQRPRHRERVAQVSWPDEAWTALRLSCLPWPIAENHTVFPDEAMVRRLMAGDGVSAVDIALRKLRVAGIRPPIRAAVADASTARLWAAALAFPISPRSTRLLAERFAPSTQKENR